MWRVLAVALVVTGCVKREPQPSPHTGEVIALGVWAESQPDAINISPPDALVRALTASLESRGLNVRRAATGEARFDRLIDVRLEQLSSQGTPWQLAVDLSARYHSQIGGRYRWNVSVVAAIAGRNRVQDRFDIPVALEFEHERASEAIAAASPEISRRVTSLLTEAVSVSQSGVDAGRQVQPTP